MNLHERAFPHVRRARSNPERPVALCVLCVLCGLTALFRIMRRTRPGRRLFALPRERVKVRGNDRSPARLCRVSKRLLDARLRGLGFDGIQLRYFARGDRPRVNPQFVNFSAIPNNSWIIAITTYSNQPIPSSAKGLLRIIPSGSHQRAIYIPGCVSQSVKRVNKREPLVCRNAD